MNNNALQKHIKNKIEEITNWEAYFEFAVDTKKIPYITFDYVELLSEDGGKHIMELIVDAWDRNTPFHINEKMDLLDKVFKSYKAVEDGLFIQIYLGTGREIIEDEDKTIKRLQRRYDVIVYE